MTDYHEVFENQVRFAETDQQGVVFYGEYVTYQDETFNAFLQEVGSGYTEMAAAGWTLHVVHVEFDYRALSRFEDVLINGWRVTAIRESSIDSDYSVRRAEDGTVVAEGHLTHVAVDTDTGETIRVPDAFRDAVVAFQDVPPDPI